MIPRLTPEEKAALIARMRAGEAPRMTAPTPEGVGVAIKLMADFSDEERAVIRERRKYQSGVELAAVFGTTWRVIAAICRED